MVFEHDATAWITIVISIWHHRPQFTWCYVKQPVFSLCSQNVAGITEKFEFHSILLMFAHSICVAWDPTQTQNKMWIVRCSELVWTSSDLVVSVWQAVVACDPVKTRCWEPSIFVSDILSAFYVHLRHLQSSQFLFVWNTLSVDNSQSSCGLSYHGYRIWTCAYIDV